MKKRLLFFLLLVVTMSVFCACGNTTSNNNQGSANEGDAVSGGSIVVGITNDLDSLDPHKAVAAGTTEVLYNIYEGLVKTDANGVMQPAVCSSYEMSDDALTYTFTLRDGVKFHNGEAVTADDVIYSLKRAAGLLDGEEGINVVSAFSIISDITKESGDGADKVVVSLSEASTELIYYCDAPIVPENYADIAKAPMGTGPFKFESYSPMESLVVVKNDDYYGDKAFLDKVTFKIFSSVDDAFPELLAGNVDVFPYLSVDQAEELEDIYNIATGDQSLVQALFINNGVAPFDDENVRKALCYAVDLDEINELLSGGASTTIRSGMFPTFKEYYDKSTESAYTHDVEKAKQLLADAGYADGFTFTIKIPSNYTFHVSTGEVIVSQLKEAGITAKIEQIDWSDWLSDVYTDRDFEATIIGLDGTMAPGDVLKRYQSTHNRNFINFYDEAYDVAYTTAINATDPAKKKAAYKECQQILTNDAASVYIMAPSQMVAVNKNLGGYTFYPIYFQDCSKLFFVE